MISVAAVAGKLRKLSSVVGKTGDVPCRFT